MPNTGQCVCSVNIIDEKIQLKEGCWARKRDIEKESVLPSSTTQEAPPNPRHLPFPLAMRLDPAADAPVLPLPEMGGEDRPVGAAAPPPPVS